MRKILFLFFLLAGCAILIILSCNLAVSVSASAKQFDDMQSLPENKVGLVLGTSRYVGGGEENLYFKYRLLAAAQLYKTGKINYIIVSGDNRLENYNEPREMLRELVKLGIPADVIHLDYAGFRTLDSVVRCKEIFGQKKFTIISQKFHNERALFIADKKGIDAVAYNAKDVELSSGFRTRAREIFARVKVVMDIYLMDTQPYFLGEKIVIE